MFGVGERGMSVTSARPQSVTVVLPASSARDPDSADTATRPRTGLTSAYPWRCPGHLLLEPSSSVAHPAGCLLRLPEAPPLGYSVPGVHFAQLQDGALRRVPRIGRKPRIGSVRGRVGTSSLLGLPDSRFGRF